MIPPAPPAESNGLALGKGGSGALATLTRSGLLQEATKSESSTRDRNRRGKGILFPQAEERPPAAFGLSETSGTKRTIPSFSSTRPSKVFLIRTSS